MKRGPVARILILVAAASAICWDIAVSSLSVEEGTFRFESDFDALSGATPTVSIVTSDYADLSDPVDRTEDPSYAQIEAMVAKAIELQGGFTDVINPGDVVLIKVNLVGGNSPSGEGENTDVRVVKALMRLIHEFTAGDVEIQVAEGTARDNDDPGVSGSVWENSGYTDLLSDPDMDGINFSFVNLNQSLDDLVDVDLAERGTSAPQGSKYKVHKAELFANVYIAVPVLKIHNTGITNALKLQIGSAPGCYYGYNKASGTTLCPDGIIHDVGHRRWTTEAIVDLSNIAGIDFVVVDAIMCLHSQKTNKDWNQVRYNTILASVDPVAVDHVSAKLMGLNPDDVAHITLAEKMGLGTNNPDDIWVTGVPIESAMKQVRKSDTEEGRFGQSNRTWTLSQSFQSMYVSEEHFVDEPFIEPIPGQDGWSEPVYFFDDRIDLHAFYEGATGIVTYAFSYFNAEAAAEAELWLGNEEGIKVYLNGEEAYSFTSYSPYGDGLIGNKKAMIQVKEGRNTLLVKSQNNYNDYSFALNICEVEDDPDYNGNRLPGLKFYIDDSGSGTQLLGNSGIEYAENHLSIRCYPNPATDHARFTFSLVEGQRVSASVFDVGGRLIRSLGSNDFPAGEAELDWDLEDGHGIRVKSGIYLCRLEYGSTQRTVRLVVR